MIIIYSINIEFLMFCIIFVIVISNLIVYNVSVLKGIMDKDKIALECIIKNIKFLGFINKEFLSGESRVESTYAHTRYDVNVVGEDFTVENVDDGNKLSVYSGDVFIVLPKTNHLVHSEGKTYVKNSSFRIEFEVAQKTTESISLYEDLVKNLSKSSMSFYFIPWAMVIVSSIIDEIKKGDFLGLQLARSEFERFIILLIREILSNNDKSLENHVKKQSNNLYEDNKVLRNEKIDHFFNSSYFIPSVTVNSLAKELNLSVRQVNRILKEEYKTPFHAKLTERRLMHGKKNLLRTDKTVEEIALRVGFSSP